MATFVAFKDDNSGDLTLMNLDGIRMIKKVKRDYCEVYFSETDKVIFKGHIATQTIDIVTQLMAGGTKINIPE